VVEADESRFGKYREVVDGKLTFFHWVVLGVVVRGDPTKIWLFEVGITYSQERSRVPPMEKDLWKQIMLTIFGTNAGLILMTDGAACYHCHYPHDHSGVLEHYSVNHSEHEWTRPENVLWDSALETRRHCLAGTQYKDSTWRRLKAEVPHGMHVKTAGARRLKMMYIRAQQWRLITEGEDRWKSFLEATRAYYQEERSHCDEPMETVTNAERQAAELEAEDAARLEVQLKVAAMQTAANTGVEPEVAALQTGAWVQSEEQWAGKDADSDISEDGGNEAADTGALHRQGEESECAEHEDILRHGLEDSDSECPRTSAEELQGDETDSRPSDSAATVNPSPMLVPTDVEFDQCTQQDVHLLKTWSQDGCGMLGYTLMDDSSNDVRRALLNRFNNCYLNSLLYSLSSVRSVRAWTSSHMRTHARGSACLLCSLGEDLSALGQEGLAFEARVVGMRTSISKEYVGSAQHDVGECFEVLLQQCHAIDENLLRGTGALDELDLALSELSLLTLPAPRIFGGLGSSRVWCGHTPCHRARLAFKRRPTFYSKRLTTVRLLLPPRLSPLLTMTGVTGSIINDFL
jgi:hypothetical protein